MSHFLIVEQSLTTILKLSLILKAILDNSQNFISADSARTWLLHVPYFLYMAINGIFDAPFQSIYFFFEQKKEKTSEYVY